MAQHVNFPTHVRGLDLEINDVANGDNTFSCEPGPFFTNHCAVKVLTKSKKVHTVSKPLVFHYFLDVSVHERTYRR